MNFYDTMMGCSPFMITMLFGVELVLNIVVLIGFIGEIVSHMLAEWRKM